MRKILFLVIVALVVVTSVQLWVTQDRTSQKKEIDNVSGQTEAQIGGDFVLTDHTGKMVHDSDFRGRVMVVYFGFTQCPDVCPLTVTMLSKVMGLLGDKADQVAPLFISIDPERDTPEVLKAFLSSFDKRIIGLTGTPAQVKQVQDAYKVYAAKKELPEQPAADYSVDHSSYLYLMGKDGRFITVMPSNAPEQEIIHTLERALSQ